MEINNVVGGLTGGALKDYGTTVKEFGSGEVVLGAAESLVETTGTALKAGGDAAMGGAAALGITDRSEEQIPWSENYKYADFDLGQANLQTGLGKTGAELMKFMAISTATGGAGVLAALGVDFAADYFNEDVKGGNFSSGVASFLPEDQRDNWLLALAHKDEDNAHIRRLKNALEGSAPNIALVGLNKLYRALRKGDMKAFEETLKAKPVEPYAAAAKAENQSVSGRPPFAEQINLNDPDLIRQTKEVMKEFEQLKAKVAANPETAQQLDIDFDLLKDGQKSLALDAAGYEEVMQKVASTTAKYGGDTRKIDDAVRTATEPVTGKPSKYDPQDRVVQTSRAANVNDSAVSFSEDVLPGGGNSLIDEVDVQEIMTVDGLRNLINEKLPEVNVDEIARRLSRQPREYVKETLRSLSDYANSGNIEALEPLRFANTFDIKGVDAGGAVVLDTLVKSVGDRITVLSKQVAELTELGGPFKVQARQILDRAEGLVTIKKEATQFSSKNLENWKAVPPDLRAAVLKDREQIAELFNELRMGLDSSDPKDVLKFKAQFSKLAIALSESGADPRLQMQMIEGLARVGMRRINSVFINSILSGPLSHIRNITGTLAAIGERTTSRAAGGLFTKGSESHKALASFDSIVDSVHEALIVAGKSWNSPYAITTPNQKMLDYVQMDR